ncbi:hypothetical protein V5093_20240 [Enterobacter cancerogenus]|uniref:hypothetical protein n=1 Tax=Enterobacter cancerogenus TaxID=69218 RepID=UPI00307630FF
MNLNRSSEQYNLITTLQYVGASANRSEALERYTENREFLKEWRFIYADYAEEGPFKLRRQLFEDKCFVSTVFRGNSLWVIDDEVVSNPGTLAFKIGMGTYLDSNAASYIRSIAYEDTPTDDVIKGCHIMAENFDNEEMKSFNPYLYLFEASHNKSEKSIEKIRETISAIFSIKMMNKPLSLSWGKEFRTQYELSAKKEADVFLAQFFKEVELGHISYMESLTDLMELILIKAKLIEYGSNRSPENKFEELLNIADSELSIFMFRELIVCADILFRSNKTQITRKLHSLQNRKRPLDEIRNCARDLGMVRMMDLLTNSIVDGNETAFYVANIVTFDKDLMDIIKVTEVNAIALHRKSHEVHIVFNAEIQAWLSEKLGDKRLQRLSSLTTFNSFDTRYKNRGHYHIKQQLISDRERLVNLLNNK